MTLAQPPATLRAQAAPRPRRAPAVLAFALVVLLLPLRPAAASPPGRAGASAHGGAAGGLRDGTAPVAALFLEEVSPGPTNLAAYWLLSRLMEVLAPVRAEWAMALLLSLLLLASLAGAVRLAGGGAAPLLPALPLAARHALHGLLRAGAGDVPGLPGAGLRGALASDGSRAALAGFARSAAGLRLADPWRCRCWRRSAAGALAGWVARAGGRGWWPPGGWSGCAWRRLPVAAAALAYGC